VCINSALQEAAEKLGASPASQEEVARLGELQQAAARDESESPALREAAAAAVTGQFGAQISLLIHQEKLDAPTGATLTSNGSRVWSTLADVARQLRAAWEELFRKLLPADVDAAGLVLAVCCGRLTVAAMVRAGMLSAKSAKVT
jgi:hypothetical protein